MRSSSELGSITFMVQSWQPVVSGSGVGNDKRVRDTSLQAGGACLQLRVAMTCHRQSTWQAMCFHITKCLVIVLWFDSVQGFTDQCMRVWGFGVWAFGGNGLRFCSDLRFFGCPSAAPAGTTTLGGERPRPSLGMPKKGPV